MVAAFALTINPDPLQCKDTIQHPLAGHWSHREAASGFEHFRRRK